MEGAARSQEILAIRSRFFMGKEQETGPKDESPGFYDLTVKSDRLPSPRLTSCAEALLEVQGRSAEEILGHPDVLKLQSSMTLFAAVSSPGSVFQRVLEKYYGGEKDQLTVRLIC